MQVFPLINPVTVYNFEVADNHNYYVGEDSVLVHNRCKIAPSSYRYSKKHNPAGTIPNRQGKVVAKVTFGRTGMATSVKHLTHHDNASKHKVPHKHIVKWFRGPNGITAQPSKKAYKYKKSIVKRRRK